jgi:hypothetical protein
MQCRRYEARLEDYLDGATDPELDKHLSQCANCRTALEDSRMAGKWLRETWEPAGEPGNAFVAGVMVRIREKEMRAQSPAALWNPLEFLASRLSLTAALLLLALSVYLVEFAPRRAATYQPTQFDQSAMDFPQPPGEPMSNEEVLLSLAGMDYGH